MLSAPALFCRLVPTGLLAGAGLPLRAAGLPGCLCAPGCRAAGLPALPGCLCAPGCRSQPRCVLPSADGWQCVRAVQRCGRRRLLRIAVFVLRRSSAEDTGRVTGLQRYIRPTAGALKLQPGHKNLQRRNQTYTTVGYTYNGHIKVAEHQNLQLTL